jgi:hypothetical protein
MSYKQISILAILLSPPVVTAAPTYLDCILEIEGRSIQWEVSINEQAGTVSMKAGTIPQIVERARFFSDRVQWGIDDAYTISRIDLSLRYVRPSGGLSQGQCQIAKSEGRKF